MFLRNQNRKRSSVNKKISIAERLEITYATISIMVEAELTTVITVSCLACLYRYIAVPNQLFQSFLTFFYNCSLIDSL